MSNRLLQETYPLSTLARLSGKQRFLIPFNVLDLVYSQTVSWVGVYYCPLLPLIGTVTLMATYYIKKVSLCFALFGNIVLNLVQGINPPKSKQYNISINKIKTKMRHSDKEIILKLIVKISSFIYLLSFCLIHLHKK